MDNNFVNWGAYDGVEGFGNGSESDIGNLKKALSAGDDINAPGSAVAGDGFALKTESLESTLRNTTFQMKHIKLWKALQKLTAYNTVEEYSLLQSYGENPDAGFIAEGALPESDDSTYERKYAKVKYLGTTRKVTHVMSLVRPAFANAIGQETINGTMHILRMLERALFTGDSDLSALQFDGFRKQLIDNAPANNIIDLRGQTLSEDVLIDAALTISDDPNYGIGTHLYINPKVKADLCKTFFPKERFNPMVGDNKGSNKVGLDLDGFVSPSGDTMFESNSFITDGGGTPAAAIGDASKIPATPTVSSAATTPVAALSQFAAADAGAYYYDVVACNRYGKSAAVAVGAGTVTLAAGDEATFGMTPGSSVSVEWYEIYRTALAGADGTERLIDRVANAAGVGEQTIHDYNANLPGCTNGYYFQQNLENMSFKQLAPMVKVPLATIDTSVRWSMLLYGCPIIYTPGKNVLFKNIGRTTGYVGQP